MAKIHDLTKGSLARHFLRLAVPAAIGMVFSTLYNVVDVFFAGLISTDAQAGPRLSPFRPFLFLSQLALALARQ
jgi:Na+-driven multidrug efflux pump